MRGTVQDSENRIARLLFKLAVEVNMMMNVLAAGMEISDEDLKTLRARSVREVKQTNGASASRTPSTTSGAWSDAQRW